MIIHDRVDRIIESYKGGADTREIAADQEIPIGAVCAILRLAGVEMRYGAPRGPSMETVRRVKAARTLRRQGMQWNRIAKEVGYNSVDQAWNACHRHSGLAQ